MVDDIEQLGPANWEMRETEPVSGGEEDAFVMDELTLPTDNPWNSHLRVTVADFLSDGRAVLASLSWDVWLLVLYQP